METEQHTPNNKLIKKKRGKEKYFLNLETNANGKTIYQHLRDAAKAIIGGMLIAINAYIKKK